MTLIIAELWRDGECTTRWTDDDGPPDLAGMLPRLRERGWTIHDFRDVDPDQTTLKGWPAVADMDKVRKDAAAQLEADAAAAKAAASAQAAARATELREAAEAEQLRVAKDDAVAAASAQAAVEAAVETEKAAKKQADEDAKAAAGDKGTGKAAP